MNPMNPSHGRTLPVSPMNTSFDRTPRNAKLVLLRQLPATSLATVMGGDDDDDAGTGAGGAGAGAGAAGAAARGGGASGHGGAADSSTHALGGYGSGRAEVYERGASLGGGLGLSPIGLPPPPAVGETPSALRGVQPGAANAAGLHPPFVVLVLLLSLLILGRLGLLRALCAAPRRATDALEPGREPCTTRCAQPSTLAPAAFGWRVPT